MIYRNLLQYKGARYFRVALVSILASIVLYLTQIGSLQPPNGGTWQGYVLGTVSGLLIVWLAYLGIRKRTYSGGTSLQGWTSAHIYLGTAVLFFATLHCAFQFGYNVHTLSYILMCLVVFSGFYGLYKYINDPQLVSRNREGESRSKLFSRLYAIDQKTLALAKTCHPTVGLAVKSGVERTEIGGSVLSQLYQTDPSVFVLTSTTENSTSTEAVENHDQNALINYVAERIPVAVKTSETRILQDLLSLLCQRQEVIRRIRRDIALQGWMKIWLYVHIPMTFALIVSLIIHILTTFMYW